MRHAKALTLTVAGVIGGTAAAVLLTLATVQFAAAPAEATPAMAKGKACNTCHSSASPSKADVGKKKKKKRAEIWTGEEENSLAEFLASAEQAHKSLAR